MTAETPNQTTAAKSPGAKSRLEAVPGGSAHGRDWESLYRRTAAGLTLFAMGISLVGLAGWLVDQPVLKGQFGLNVPMAPAAILTLLLFGSALCLHALVPSSVSLFHRAYVVTVAVL